MWGGEELKYVHFKLTLAFEFCLCWTFNPSSTEAMGMLMSRVGQAEEGRKPFLQGSVAGADVFLGFIYARVAQKYSNARTVLSDNLILPYMLCGVVDFCGF